MVVRRVASVRVAAVQSCQSVEENIDEGMKVSEV